MKCYNCKKKEATRKITIGDLIVFSCEGNCLLGYMKEKNFYYIIQGIRK